MPATYEPIATTTLGSAASTITFSSIPATYTDLRIALVVNGTSTTNRVGLQYNSDTGSNYSFTYLRGDGASAISGANTANPQIRISAANQASTSLQFVTFDIFSYAGSTNKTSLATLQNDRNGSGDVIYSVGLWRNTAAITTATLMLLNAGNYNTGTTATLYGIKNA